MDNLLVTITRTDLKVHFEGVSKDNPDISVPLTLHRPSERERALRGSRCCS